MLFLDWGPGGAVYLSSHTKHRISDIFETLNKGFSTLLGVTNYLGNFLKMQRCEPNPRDSDSLILE